MMEDMITNIGDNNQITGKEKDYNIECLRVMSCILVVCIHVANYYSRGYGEISEGSYVFSLLVNAAARVAVPIFFMISGSLLISEPVSLSKCLKRTRNMLGALVLWSSIYLVWNNYYRGVGYDFHQILDRPVKLHLWYLYVLAGLYLILPFLQCMLSHMPKSLYSYFILLWLGCLCINEILFQLHIDVKYPVPMVGDSCYLGYFLMGYFLKNSLDQIPLRAGKCGLLSALCLLTAMGETLFVTWKKGIHNEHFFEYRNLWIALGAILLFVSVLKKKDRQYSHGVKRGLDMISRHSFTIYLCHVLFLDVMKLEMRPREISAFIGIPLFVLGIFAASFLFSVVWDGAWRKIKLCYNSRNLRTKEQEMQEKVAWSKNEGGRMRWKNRE